MTCAQSADGSPSTGYGERDMGVWQNHGKYGKNSISLLFGVREKYNNDKREVKTFAMFAIHAITPCDPTLISTPVRKWNGGVGVPVSLSMWMEICGRWRHHRHCD